MIRSLRRHALGALALGAALVSAHCQRGADAPPGASAASCCEVTPNAALPEGRGNLLVSYPGDGAESTRLDVYASGDASESIGGEYGDATLELSPGTYDVTISGRRVAGVGVLEGHDTRIRVGVLHVHAGDGTRIDLLEPDSDAKLTGGYGEDQYGLPVGTVAVEIAGQRETALIEDGKITEF